MNFITKHFICMHTFFFEQEKKKRIEKFLHCLD